MQEFEEENVPIGPLFMTLGVTAFFTLAIIFGLTGLYEGLSTHYQDEWAAQQPQDVVDYHEQTEAQLTTYQKGDGDVVRIPVERAMDLVLEARSK
jgi:hypothetical protein